MSYHHEPSPAISHISRAAALSKEATHSSGYPSRLLSISWARNLQAKLILRQSANLPIYPSDLTMVKPGLDSLAAELGGKGREELRNKVSENSETWPVST